MSNLSETEESSDGLLDDYLFYCSSQPLNAKGCSGSFEEVNFEGSPLLPEKALLYEVLGRAYHDLVSNVPHEVRRDAIKWFEARNSDYESFSYKYIIQALDLGYKYQNLITVAIAQARLMR